MSDAAVDTRGDGPSFGLPLCTCLDLLHRLGSMNAFLFTVTTSDESEGLQTDNSNIMTDRTTL